MTPRVAAELFVAGVPRVVGFATVLRVDIAAWMTITFDARHILATSKWRIGNRVALCARDAAMVAASDWKLGFWVRFGFARGVARQTEIVFGTVPRIARARVVVRVNVGLHVTRGVDAIGVGTSVMLPTVEVGIVTIGAIDVHVSAGGDWKARFRMRVFIVPVNFSMAVATLLFILRMVRLQRIGSVVVGQMAINAFGA